MEELLERYANVPERFRYAGAVGVVAALLAAHYTFVYTEQEATLAALRAQYDRLDAERTEKRAYADNLSKYEARLVQLQESLATARAMLPDSADVAQLLAQIGSRGEQSGLTILRFEPKAESEHDFYAELSFEMKVLGSYHEIGTFVDSLGKLDRIINVTDISMSNPKVVNQKVVVESGFVLRTYRFLSGGPAVGKQGHKKKRAKR